MSENKASGVDLPDELVKKKSSVVWKWFGFKLSDIDQQTVAYSVSCVVELC